MLRSSKLKMANLFAHVNRQRLDLTGVAFWIGQSVAQFVSKVDEKLSYYFACSAAVVFMTILIVTVCEESVNVFVRLANHKLRKVRRRLLYAGTAAVVFESAGCLVSYVVMFYFMRFDLSYVCGWLIILLIILSFSCTHCSVTNGVKGIAWLGLSCLTTKCFNENDFITAALYGAIQLLLTYAILLQARLY